MKNIIIGIAVIALLGLGYWGYKYMNSNSASGAGPNGKKMAQQNPVSGKMSIKDLMNLGTTQTCTFTSKTPEGTTSGASYISGQKVRTDFTTTDPAGKSTEGHIIMDGSYMYSWSNESEPGFKMQITEDLANTIEESKESISEYQQAYNPDEKIDYNCSSWSMDVGQFTPPANVTFTDFSEQLKMMQEGIKEQSVESVESEESTGTANQCSTCDSVPAEAQAACKQALGCE